MDTSETYIKMCKKAVEIHKARILCVGDYYAYRNDFGYLVVGTDSLPATAHKIFIGGCIWLPRQDQLQEMSLEIVNDIKQIPISLIGKVCQYDSIPMWMNSWEQFWLAFVMKKRYSKIWNGDDWVKA